MNNEQKTNGLKLLNDNVFDKKTGKDAFNHGIYAELLAKIFSPSSGNDPGISVALFGKWGQGKSSVVQMMEDRFEKEKKDTSIQQIGNAPQSVKNVIRNFATDNGKSLDESRKAAIIDILGTDIFKAKESRAE